MKKGLFWLVIAAGIVAAVVLIRRRRSEFELEEWDSLADAPTARASDILESVKDSGTKDAAA